MSPDVSTVDVAVIGGTGFYAFLQDSSDGTEEHAVVTPYGEPSAPVTVGTVAGRRVAFLPRHGRHHDFPPHLINYRANLWALRSLGVRQEGVEAGAADDGDVGDRGHFWAHFWDTGRSSARQTAAHTCLGAIPASSASSAVRPPSSAMTNWLAQDR